MKFYYRAIDNAGKKTTGIIECDSPGRVRDILSQKGLIPVAVGSSPFVEKKRPGSGLFQSSRVSDKERIQFIRRLATLLGASCPIDKAFDMIIRRAESRPLQQMAKSMKDQIEAGKSLSKAMAGHPEVFSGMHVGMAAAGDEGGFLARALEQLADYEEEQARLRSELVTAMIYPAFMIGVLVLSCIVLFKFVVPSILGIVTQTAATLPLPTRILVSLSDLLEQHLGKAVALIVLLVYAYLSFIKTETGRVFHDGLMLDLPVFGAISRHVIVSRVCRILGMLLEGGVNLVRSIEIATGTAQNVIVERELNSVARKVQTGEDLSACFEVLDVFPGYVAAMIQLGEETGSLEKMLSRVAGEYEQEYQSSLKGAVALVEPLMIAIMGLVIGFVVIAVFMPMADMTSHI